MAKGGIENMTTRQKELLLMQCMYRVTPEQRAFLMVECSDAYNAWCGDEIVTVSRTSDQMTLRIVEGPGYGMEPDHRRRVEYVEAQR